ncbi:TPA: hypothetical protein DD449_00435 [Candidatus Berkelbacteria bacterium]|uniref:Uncharacterized protein n=1 Tax=Berkelbacteria bacterium GW2011_GWE1_39_12 TaxID=1618337 RepID=A0A0G4B5E4_9BACT|nr:MAG: hypothetical protein UT28_C0001G1001 [Berkelbacteria bacterium GW2011_GWE1_39_12]HBO60140.1 hypothetical protein [Candidatus Berkelbacteria bacterium]
MKFRKILFVVLGILVIAAIVTVVWSLVQNKNLKNEQTAIRNVNVQSLTSDDEKKVGTIIYAGAKKDGEVVTTNGNQTINLTSTDSVDGAFNIYYQDVLNRYKTYSVNKKEVSKSDALNKISRVITVSGQTGKITITVWGDNKGVTHIQIVTTSDFK